MKQPNANVLAINGGSSSIKFAVYTMGDARQRRLHGKLERIGLRDTTLTFDDPSHHQHGNRIIGNFDHHAAANFLIDWLEQHVGLASLAAVGHRIVNGGADYDEPQRVTPELLDALRRISAYAPEHLPAEIALIDLFRERVPSCRKWCASIPHFIARCRASRKFCRFRAACRRRASSVMDFTDCRMRF